jgi:nucleoside-diphosphate-sugar epimerase
MRVFVTGGTGFVGAHLVSALVKRGDDVTCLVRNPAKAEALGWRNVTLIRGDLDDRAALREGCVGADVIYHVAGRISARDLDEFMRVNRDGTERVVEAAASARPSSRLVLVSSIAAVGPTTRGQPMDESRVPAPVTDYGRSKLAAELVVRQAPCEWTIVRPVVVYGEWDREILKVFRVTRRGIAPVFGRGDQEISVIYGGDLAGALIAAGTTSTAAGRVYFAAHPKTVTTREFSVAIGNAVGREVRVIGVPRPLARAALWAIGSAAHLVGVTTVLSADKANEFLAPAWTCTPAALERDTGWTATTPLMSGLARTAVWYREQGWL